MEEEADELTTFVSSSDVKSLETNKMSLILKIIAALGLLSMSLVIFTIIDVFGKAKISEANTDVVLPIKIANIDSLENDLLDAEIELEHVNGHGSGFRISLGDKEEDLYLHHSIVSTSMTCENKPKTVKFSSDKEFYSYNTEFDKFRLVYWIGEEGKKRVVAPDYLGCMLYESGVSHYFFVSYLVNVVLLETSKQVLSYYTGMEVARAKRKPATRKFHIPDILNNKFILFADSGTQGRNYVLESMLDTSVSSRSIVHIGDLSYASNTGECYAARQGKASEPMQSQCEWDCSVENRDCRGRIRNNFRVENAWAAFMKETTELLESKPMMTTMGNHDNDIYWFYKFRPTHKSSFPLVNLRIDFSRSVKRSYQNLFNAKAPDLLSHQSIISDIMREPYFYSFTQGLIQFISIGTEDNPVNPYEINRVKNGSMPLMYRERFQKHYGKTSKQYQWLERILKSIDRQKHPWVVVYTHRPLFHTNNHHRVCSGKGAWFGCHFRNLYTELFERYKVNLVVSGHSHHYSRSLPILNSFDYTLNDYFFETGVEKHSELLSAKRPYPIIMNMPPLVDNMNGVVYCVIGTAGFELDPNFMQEKKPGWVGFRQGYIFGYATIEALDHNKLEWKYIGTSETITRVLDQVVLTR